MKKLKIPRFLVTRTFRKSTSFKDHPWSYKTNGCIISELVLDTSALGTRNPGKIKSFLKEIEYLRLDSISDYPGDNLPIVLTGGNFQINRNFNDCLHDKNLRKLIFIMRKYNETCHQVLEEEHLRDKSENQGIPRKITPWEKNMNLIHSLC